MSQLDQVDLSRADVDPDPTETREWVDAMHAVLATQGPARVRQLMDRLAIQARQPEVDWQPARGTPYVNTVPVQRQAPFPGDLATEERLASIMRWNALAMVVRANQAHGRAGRPHRPSRPWTNARA